MKGWTIVSDDGDTLLCEKNGRVRRYWVGDPYGRRTYREYTVGLPKDEYKLDCRELLRELWSYVAGRYVEGYLPAWLIDQIREKLKRE